MSITREFAEGLGIAVLILLGSFKDTKGQWESSLEGCDFLALLPFFPKLSLAKSTRASWGWLTPGILAGRSFPDRLPAIPFLPLFFFIPLTLWFQSLGSQGPDAEQVLFGEILECVC